MNKVLVVDDEESFTDLVSRIVEKHGLTVRTASSADEFEDIFFEFEPQVAVIDIVMPERDGFELIDWLKHQAHRCAVILVSGKSQDYVRQAGILAETGGLKVAGTMTKPIDAGQLLAAIASAKA